MGVTLSKITNHIELITDENIRNEMWANFGVTLFSLSLGILGFLYGTGRILSSEEAKRTKKKTRRDSLIGLGIAIFFLLIMFFYYLVKRWLLP